MAVGDDLPPLKSLFGNLPLADRTAELRYAGERERAENKAAAELAAIKDARVLPRRRPGLEDKERPGNRAPHRFDWALAARAVPFLLVKGFSGIVPDTHFERDERTSEATIHCTCGETPTIWPERSTLCACDRLFIDIGTEIRVCKLENGDEPVPDS